MAEAAAGAPEQGAGAAAAAPEAAAAAPPLILRFLFANERARLEMEVPETCSVPELKARLLAAWPEGLERTPTPVTTQQMQLLAFGKFCADTSSLSRLPRFPHPTPIHVMVTPAVTPASSRASSDAAAGCCAVS